MVMAHTDRSAHRSASYVTTPCLGIPTQHSDERECERDYNNDLAHINLPIQPNVLHDHIAARPSSLFANISVPQYPPRAAA
jgi:hypothetical protein